MPLFYSTESGSRLKSMVSTRLMRSRRHSKTYETHTADDCDHHWWNAATVSRWRSDVGIDGYRTDVRIIVPSRIHSDFTINTYSLEYTVRKLTLSGEYSIFITETDDGGSPDGWYYRANYQVSDKLSFSSYYSLYYSDSKDRSGKDLDINFVPDHYRWRSR